MPSKDAIAASEKVTLAEAPESCCHAINDMMRSRGTASWFHPMPKAFLTDREAITALTVRSASA